MKKKRSVWVRILMWSGIAVVVLFAIGAVGNAIDPVKATPRPEPTKSAAAEGTTTTAPAATTETTTETTTTEDTASASAEDSLGPTYPSPRIGDTQAYEAAYRACDDGITAEPLCMCIAAKLSERPDAATLDYPTLLDYNNPNPPWYLIDITGSCQPEIG
jgi:hypothetical protein